MRHRSPFIILFYKKIINYKFFKYFLILIVYYPFFQLNAQPLSKEVYPYKALKLYYDSGLYWENLSSIHSIRRQDILFLEDSSFYLPSISHELVYMDQSFLINRVGSHNFKNYFYVYYDLSFIQNNISKQTKNNNKNKIKLNSSGFGFQNDWATAQLGKGIENWGSGNKIDLLLSENSEPYEYFMLSSNYGRIRVNYIHGFLEHLSDENNRYLVSRGIEWSNNKDKVFSLSETVIYSGINRSIDFGYLNPIGSHLEIELNERLNRLGTNYSNAGWQLHIDLLLKKSLRFSMNYLFDEFVFDPDIEIGKENGKAFSIRISKSIISKKNQFLNLYTSFLKVGTPTFRHSNGYLNFVNNRKPLGWIYGSDGDELSLGVASLKTGTYIFDLSLSYLRYGEESIFRRPYDPYFDYLDGVFPSGKISKIFAIFQE